MAGGLPDIRRLAQLVGDGSALTKTWFPRTAEDMEGLQNRIVNRAIGRAGGKAFGFFKARFNVWGLIAVAEFFDLLKKVVQAEAAKPFWFGSMAAYARWVNNGFTHARTGKAIAGRPYFTRALVFAEEERTKSGALKGFLKPPGLKSFKNPRTGLYEGQKFIGDLGFLARGKGGFTGRLARREAGRQVAGFFWGTLRNPERNILEAFAESVVKHARKQIRVMDIEDTGTLRASLATGATEFEFMNNSIEQMREWMRSRNITGGDARRRLGLQTQFGVGGEFVEMLGPRAATAMPE